MEQEKDDGAAAAKPADASAPPVAAYIIHLARAESRAAQAEALRRQLAAMPACLEAQILPARDAQNLTAAEIAAVYRRKIFAPFYPFQLKAAEIACFLSHRAAWQNLLDSGAPAGFISEDDMRPRANFSEAFALARAQIHNCGLIRFPHRDREKGSVIGQSGQTQLIRPRFIGLGAVAYMIDRRAAAKLLAATRHFDRPLDVFLQMFWVSGVRPGSLRPGGITEISAQLGGSTLTQQRSSPAEKLRRELRRPLYRAQIALLSLCRIWRGGI